MLDPHRLETILAHAPSLKVGLLGDLFLDRYLEIDPAHNEVSIETGLAAYQVQRVRNAPGALGTVMNNLAALGVGELVPLTVIGEDGHGDDLMRALQPLPCDVAGVIRDSERLTPTYTKPLQLAADGSWVERNRLDFRTRGPLSPASCRALTDALRTAYAACDGLIVLDQVNETDWGVVNETIRTVLADLVATNPAKLVFIDSRNHLGEFAGGILKANRDELLKLDADAGGAAPDRGVESAATRLAGRIGKTVFCTLGPDGILIAPVDGPVVTVPGIPVDGPLDIVGAGDSATSGIVTALLGGASEQEAAAVGNLAASITVQQLGTTGTATPQQLLARCRQHDR